MIAVHDGTTDEAPTVHAPPASRGTPAGPIIATHRQPLAATLARLDHVELRTLGAELHELLHVAPDFVWWVARLANWETNRRAGVDATWPPDPDGAAASSADAGRIVPAMVMRDKFAQEPARDTPNLAAFFDTIVGAITGRGGSKRPELQTTG